MHHVAKSRNLGSRWRGGGASSARSDTLTCAVEQAERYARQGLPEVRVGNHLYGEFVEGDPAALLHREAALGWIDEVC